MSRAKIKYRKKPVILYVSEDFFQAINALKNSMNDNLKKRNKGKKIRLVCRNDLFVEALQDWADKVGMNCRVDYRENNKDD